VLEEIGDDAIVAHSTVHSPLPRVHVEIETRSVVIAENAEIDPNPLPAHEPPSERTPVRQLPKYGANVEPTRVIRAKRTVDDAALYDSFRPSRKRWPTALIWGAAALVALGFGAVLALFGRGAFDRSGSATATASATVELPPPKPVATKIEPTPSDKTESDQPTRNDESASAVSAGELPVESATRPSRPAASSSASKAKTRAPTPKPQPQPRSDIPTGI